MWVYGVLILCVLLYINELLTTCCVGYIIITILVPYVINIVHTACKSILIISYGFS
jgi:ABC-type phosphate transport system permease subunit